MRDLREGAAMIAGQCHHYACRCARAAELAAQADKAGDPRLLFEAQQVHYRAVPCRRLRPEQTISHGVILR